MQTGTSYDLERRIRYYQSSIDRRTLKSSENYRDLRQSYIIFICTNDYYKRGLAVYRRKSVIKGASDILYEDGSNAYILNAAFTEGNASPDVLGFLRYIDSGYRGVPIEIQTDYVAQIERTVERVKSDEELEGTYMTLAMKLQDVRQEGIQEGIQEGTRDTLLANIKLMIKNLGISPEKAMDILEVPADVCPEYLKLLEQ